MAGEWIKMRSDLQTHPKIVRLSSALKADRLRAVGALHAVWSLFDTHSVDGKLDGYTPSALDDLIGWSGFSGALAAVQWLEIGPDYLSLPRFDEHNGKSAKRRATDLERKRNSRVDEQAQPVLHVSAADADEKRTREEKRREEEEQRGQALQTTPQRTRPTRLANDWKLPDDWASWALEQRKDWNRAHLAQVAAVFADHWRGKGEARADWRATWRNWVRREDSKPLSVVNGGAGPKWD